MNEIVKKHNELVSEIKHFILLSQAKVIHAVDVC